MTYDERRYETLREVITDYLDDSDGTAQSFLDDLKRGLQENVQYFQGRVDQYTQLQEFFNVQESTDRCHWCESVPCKCKHG